ncbi:MAG: response regulator [Acidobacteria bacterium]|nr:response regulator [Acidobacteriota bacterium]
MKTARGQGRPAGFRSLATRFFVFTASLLSWVVLTLFTLDLRDESMSWSKWALVSVMMVLVAGVLSRFTTRLLARPLMLLEEGIRSVTEGRLEPIQVSKTGDEIESLGHSFNRMIERLILTQNEVRQHQETLEQRIRQRTEELERTMQRAQAASQAKSEFLANMSHELRTPMNGVLGMIDIVLDSPLTGEQREQLETAHRCAHSLLALLNDVLDLSKIEAGKMVLERIPFDLRVLIEDAVSTHRPKASKKGVTISVEVGPEVPRRITADPLRIRQVLSNLLSNAVKFTERGSVRVHARRAAQEHGHGLLLEVIDTGVGIPAEKLAEIFEKFTQADGSISRRYGGTGLGLAITRKLVEMHEGEIIVDSQVGRGSTFGILLPVSVCHAEAAAEAEAVVLTPEISCEERKGAPPAILVVEDNHVNQKVVNAILRKHGYHVDVANHGREALEYLDLLAYGLVLMDVQMPVLDGLETTRAIRRDPRFRNLPVVAMTAHAMSGDRERCLAAGMNGYVAKPLNPSLLLRVVEDFLQRSQEPALAAPVAEPRLPIDSWAAVQLSESDPSLLVELQRLFMQLTPNRIEKLHQSVQHADFANLEQEAGRLRVSAEKIAALKVAEAARELEEWARAGDLDKIRQNMESLEHEIGLASRHLQRVCQAV